MVGYSYVNDLTFYKEIQDAGSADIANCVAACAAAVTNRQTRGVKSETQAWAGVGGARSPPLSQLLAVPASWGPLDSYHPTPLPLPRGLLCESVCPVSQGHQPLHPGPTLLRRDLALTQHSCKQGGPHGCGGEDAAVSSGEPHSPRDPLLPALGSERVMLSGGAAEPEAQGRVPVAWPFGRRDSGLRAGPAASWK